MILKIFLFDFKSLISPKQWKKSIFFKSIWLGIALVFFNLTCVMALADTLIVMEVRGTNLKSGATIDGDKAIQLAEGERLTVIRTDGMTVTIKGPFNGIPIPKQASSSDPKNAFSALLANRDARTNSIGVIRAGFNAKEIPDPWYLDVTRSGVRCVLEGSKPIFWRPLTDTESNLTILPIDKSFQIKAQFEKGIDSIYFNELQINNTNLFFKFIFEEQEFPIQMIIIPKDISNELVLSAWMIEKGCVQQADALIKKIQLAYETK